MILNSLINSDVDDVFMQTDDFGVAAVLEDGEDNDLKSGTVILVEDHLEGTREVQGDGRLLNRDDGRRIRESAVIECKSDWPVAEYPGHGKAVQFFKINGERWFVKRIISRDDDMISVLVTQSREQVINKPRRRG